jgi:hypothetical protein
MVGTATLAAPWASRRAFAPQSSQLGAIDELEGLRKLLTEAEFASAKRHLLAG